MKAQFSRDTFVWEPCWAAAAWARFIVRTMSTSTAMLRSKCSRDRSPSPATEWQRLQARSASIGLSQSPEYRGHPWPGRIGRCVRTGARVGGRSHTGGSPRAGAPFGWSEALSDCATDRGGAAGCHERGIVHRDLKPANLKAPDEGPAEGAGLWTCKTERRARCNGFFERIVEVTRQRAVPGNERRRRNSRHGSLHVTRAGPRQGRGQAN